MHKTTNNKQQIPTTTNNKLFQKSNLIFSGSSQRVSE